ncbi:MAG: methyltransferase domain-containing protein [Nitrospirae bacterium]|nr:methyltransferase domain-containing protein [Nitrospirota bacterium]
MIILEKTDTFDPSAFERLKKAEEKHFWFQIRRKWIFTKIRKFIAPPAKILEVGCGTGNVSSFLAQKGYKVTGCEFYSEAIKRAWQGFLMVQGDANNLPFREDSFDIIGLFDVIEHFQDDISILKEAYRVVRRGGIVTVTVPAREELWSWFDETSLHKRRYTKENLKQIFLKSNLKPLLSEYIFMLLYPFMKYTRGNERKKGANPFKINRLSNTLFRSIFDTERHLSNYFSFPIGTSLIGVACKPN